MHPSDVYQTNRRLYKTEREMVGRRMRENKWDAPRTVMKQTAEKVRRKLAPSADASAGVTHRLHGFGGGGGGGRPPTAPDIAPGSARAGPCAAALNQHVAPPTVPAGTNEKNRQPCRAAHCTQPHRVAVSLQLPQGVGAM